MQPLPRPDVSRHPAWRCGLCGMILLPLLMPLLISNVAWGAGSTKVIDQANQSRLANEAELASAKGQYSDASIRFESLGAQGNPNQRDHWLLKAARNAQLAGDEVKAQTLLATTGKNLNAEDAALKALVTAVQANRAKQPERALAALDEIPLPLPSAYATDLLGTRIDALFALGRVALAVNTAVERERLFARSEDITQARQQLWTQLTQALSSGRDLTIPAGVAKITAGWLELARLSVTRQRDPFGYARGMNDWRTRYPDHPGSAVLAAATSTRLNNVSNSGPQRIALLLPLTGRQQAAGIAVRDGFMAAALRASTRPGIDVFDTNEKGAVDAYQRALQGGATMVIGPLLKEDVQAIANSQGVGVTTLALNALGTDGAAPVPAPALMFRFALDPEDEARLVARRAWDEGLRRAIVLTPANEWGQRMQRAFVAELQQLGGTVVTANSYAPNATDYVRPLRQVFGSRQVAAERDDNNAAASTRRVTESRSDFDYVFMAAQGTQARQLRPAIKFVMANNQIPVYSTSDSIDPANSSTDLDDLRFADMPWVINRDAELSSLYDSMNRVWSGGLRSRMRLYAFGIDAFRLSGWLNTPQPQWSAPLRGATGQLALDQSGVVHRELEWAQIVNGKPQVLPEVRSTR